MTCFVLSCAGTKEGAGQVEAATPSAQPKPLLKEVSPAQKRQKRSAPPALEKSCAEAADDVILREGSDLEAEVDADHQPLRARKRRLQKKHAAPPAQDTSATDDALNDDGVELGERVEVQERVELDPMPNKSSDPNAAANADPSGGELQRERQGRGTTPLPLSLVSL